MPYGETYSNSERSLAEAIADAILARDPSTTRILEIRDRFDILLDLLEGVITPDGRLKVDLPTFKYVCQQNDLSGVWIVRSPLKFPQTSVFLTQIEETLLTQPKEVLAAKEFIDEYSIKISFNEPCLGFVIIS